MGEMDLQADVATERQQPYGHAREAVSRAEILAGAVSMGAFSLILLRSD
jgi:hypothetical protein